METDDQLDMELYEYGEKDNYYMTSSYKPSTLLNSIFMFTVNAASKTLVSVASQSKSGRNNKRKTGEHLRFLIMLMTWTALWVLKVLMDHLIPCSTVSLSSSSSLTGLSSLDLYVGADDLIRALQRALSQILTLVNQIPATSPKYQSVMAMANKFMEENAKDGHVELVDINRTVLASAFERTLNL